MIASEECQHSERVPQVEEYDMGVLPVAAIYGGNASGKSNLVKALAFAKRFIVKGVQPDSLIPVDQFLLDPESAKQPTCFEFELLINDVIYEFSFSVTRKIILKEKLVRISSKDEEVLYHRKDGKLNFNSQFIDSIDPQDAGFIIDYMALTDQPPLSEQTVKDLFLKFAFQGTQDNQLFLTNAVSQKVENFKPIYDWFKDSLELITPDSSWVVDKGETLFSIINTILPQLDTGIARLETEEMPFEKAPFSEGIKLEIQENAQKGVTTYVTNLSNERFVLTVENGELIVRKQVAYHPKSDGTEAKFEMHQESDGTQRLIDILPFFLTLSQPYGGVSITDTSSPDKPPVEVKYPSNKVVIIDELDRSLHTLLTKRLLEIYFSGCFSESRSQLIFTTHDVSLTELLRVDEIWVAERDVTGNSTLIPFSDYPEAQQDRDIRKSYMQGRLGGIPHILLNGALIDPAGSEELERET